MSDNGPYSEQFRVIAKRWVDADAAATLLEDTKSAFFSSRVQEIIKSEPGIAMNRAENIVRSADYWKEWVEQMVEARKQANLLKLQMEYLRMKFTEWNSHEASKRAEMRL